MSNSVSKTLSLGERFAEIFTYLHEQDIEQFYAHYQLWVLRRRLPIVEQQIEVLKRQLEESEQVLQALQPPVVALTVLARFQSLGVHDIDLLGKLLDRGEDWLDRMMQRLDYCEQVEDFIQGDYAQWCVNSLEGAYDWIDSLRGSLDHDHRSEELARHSGDRPGSDAEDALATEELLRQKLSSEDEESMRAATVKMPVLTPAQLAGDREPPQELTELVESIANTEAEQVALPAVEQREVVDEPPIEESQNGSEEERPAEVMVEPDLETNQAVLASLPAAEREPDQLLDLDQPGTMDDWVKVLQEDALARLEAGETELVTYGVAEIILPEVREEQTSSPLQQESTQPAQDADVFLLPASENEREANVTVAGVLNSTDEESIQSRAKLESAESELDVPGQPTDASSLSEVTQIEAAPAEEVIPETVADDLEQQAIVEEAAREPVLMSQEREDLAPAKSLHSQETEEQEPVEILPEMSEDAQQADLKLGQEFAEHAAEIEDAGIANAVPYEEEDQLPWYEYLELEKDGSSGAQDASEIAAHSELENDGDLEDYASEEIEISKLSTQPYVTISDVPDSLVEVQEEREAHQDLSGDEIADKSELLDTLQAETKTPAEASGEIVSTQAAGETVANTSAMSEQRTGLDREDEMPGEQKQESAWEEVVRPGEGSENEQLVVAPQGVSQPSQADPGEVAPKKPGFWRRLFRSKKRT